MMNDTAASKGGVLLSQEMGGEIWRPLPPTMHRYHVRPVVNTPQRSFQLQGKPLVIAGQHSSVCAAYCSTTTVQQAYVTGALWPYSASEDGAAAAEHPK